MGEREQKIQALTRQLQDWGAFVISVPGSDTLRFQILIPQCESILAKLKAWEWEPTQRNYGLRFTNAGAEPCMTYELAVPADRQEIPQQDIIRDEIGKGKKNPEVEAMLQAIYGKQR